MTKKKVAIVGGAASGATCATRLRRLDESAQIVVLDRGPYVSFANCGLPYYVGDVIQNEAKLRLATPELFRERFNVDVRTRNEVTAIDRQACDVLVRELETGREYREHYDALVLSPGAAPIRPPLPGIDIPEIFTRRTVPDGGDIRDWVESKSPRKAVVVGGGFIGLELAENFVQRGIDVTVVEMAKRLMSPLDQEMAEYVRRHLASHAVHLQMGDGVAGFGRAADGSLVVHTLSGAAFAADLVVLSIGVRSETKLAREASLTIGERGGIRVDMQMRTGDPRIWAIGDAVEVRNRLTGQRELVPLAGLANRQGRIAADAICRRPSHFHDVQATAVCGLFGLTAALTGATEKSLRRAGIDDSGAVYLHPGRHAGYYPGAKSIHLKLVFRRSDGLVSGAQAIGEEGVERRIDVISTAIQVRPTVFDLEESELCYAPQYGAARDPVNLAGMIASNVVRGHVELAPWPDLRTAGAMLLNVREPDEFDGGCLDGAVNIPLGRLRARMDELPHDREICVNCRAGQRACYACRLLSQNGFSVRNLSGGCRTYRDWYPEDRIRNGTA